MPHSNTNPTLQRDVDQILVKFPYPGTIDKIIRIREHFNLTLVESKNVCENFRDRLNSGDIAMEVELLGPDARYAVKATPPRLVYPIYHYLTGNTVELIIKELRGAVDIAYGAKSLDHGPLVAKLREAEAYFNTHYVEETV